MGKKELIKYFYENIVSNNLIDEMEKYIADDCVTRIGEENILTGKEGMKQYVLIDYFYSF